MILHIVSDMLSPPLYDDVTFCFQFYFLCLYTARIFSV